LTSQQDTASTSDACTAACTKTPETANDYSLDALAAALRGLSPRDRAKLAAMLLAETSGLERGSGPAACSDAGHAASEESGANAYEHRRRSAS
jgi:hypothetical protein